MTLDTETTPAVPKRRRGRPRKDDADREVRRAEIMNAAVQLFVDNGYRETTMSDIARSIGLNQSSLYYWFKDKEDLLEAIMKDNTTSFKLASRLSEMPGEHPLHLYATVYADTLMMCNFPFDYFELENVALSHPRRFGVFFDTYRDLRETIGRIIRDGVEDGDFPADTKPELAMSIVLSLAEGLQHQYHQSTSTLGEEAIDVWNGIPQQTPEQLARLAADSAINAVSGTIDTEVLFATAVERGWIAQA